MKALYATIALTLIFITTVIFNSHPKAPVVTLQIAENQLILNNKTIESASIDFAKDSALVYLKLRKKAASDLNSITEKNIGELATFSVDGQVIFSSNIQGKIGKEFFLGPFTKTAAVRFVKNLKLSKQQGIKK